MTVSFTKAVSRPSAADPLGFDFRVKTDLDPTGRSATGLELVEAAILHRLMADELLMIGAPNGVIPFGINLRKRIGEAMTDASAAALKPAIEEAIGRDVRIAEVTATVRRTSGAAARWALLVSIRAVIISGVTIDRVIGVSLVSVEFLAEGR